MSEHKEESSIDHSADGYSGDNMQNLNSDVDIEAVKSYQGDRDYENLGADDNSYTASRVVSAHITNSKELLREALMSKQPIPPMGNGRDYPPPVPGSDEEYLVTFDGPDDPYKPLNWSTGRKVKNTAIFVMCALSISLGSAMFSMGIEDIMEQYHVGWTVATLGTSLYVLGFAAGPIIQGPLSELHGRKVVMALCIFTFTCFNFAVATAKDFQTITICRFFAGFSGAASLVVSPAANADMFNVFERGISLAFFGAALFGGPMLGPILGGFTSKNSSLGWRWNSYFVGILGGASLVLVLFFFEETNHAVLLVRRAEEIRRRTGNRAIYAAHETVSLDFAETAKKTLIRPVKMLFREPILFLVSIYNAFVYGLLYLFLTAVPLIFQVNYQFTAGVSELPYISMLIGVWIGCGINICFDMRYNKALRKSGKVPPEFRLPGMIVGGVLFTIGLFWMGWSGSFPQQVHWIVPTIGAAFVGAGLLLVFLPSLNYIVECYLMLAASGLAANAFVRSAFGAAFPLFARQMFVNLEPKWATTLIGCLSAILIPVPIVFYFFGAKIRKLSKFAVSSS